MAPAPVVSSGLNLVMVLLSLFLPLIGIIAGVVYMVQPEMEKKRAGKRWLIVSLVALVLWFFFSACLSLLAGIEGGYYY